MAAGLRYPKTLTAAEWYPRVNVYNSMWKTHGKTMENPMDFLGAWSINGVRFHIYISLPGYLPHGLSEKKIPLNPLIHHVQHKENTNQAHEQKHNPGGLEHEFYDFPFSWECHHPNWRTHIFQRGRSTTNHPKIIRKVSGVSTRSTVRWPSLQCLGRNWDELWAVTIKEHL